MSRLRSLSLPSVRSSGSWVVWKAAASLSHQVFAMFCLLDGRCASSWLRPDARALPTMAGAALSFRYRSSCDGGTDDPMDVAARVCVCRRYTLSGVDSGSRRQGRSRRLTPAAAADPANHARSHGHEARVPVKLQWDASGCGTSGSWSSSLTRARSSVHLSGCSHSAVFMTACLPCARIHTHATVAGRS